MHHHIDQCKGIKRKTGLIHTISTDCSNRCQFKYEIKTLMDERIYLISQAQIDMVGSEESLSKTQIS